ncbi:hypothetical protein ACEUZ9_003651 [Paracoccus litorisediminis]|jgi:hypothetical protein|uniref:hypothetical protein n=1 Tax=Paracoccus litorisediminis TaxID=2006130 RepID=UPI00372D92D6
MCCATMPAPKPPRRATTRAAYLCRASGLRGCRCHVTARLRLSHTRLQPPRLLRVPVAEMPQRAPRRPQAPPLSA